MKKFKKLFSQRGLNFMTVTMELTCVLPYIGKNSLYLRACPGQTIKRILNSKKVIPIKDILIDYIQIKQDVLKY